MRTVPNEDVIKERREIWQWIRLWMKKSGFTAERLSFPQTPYSPYSQDLIEKGTKGEPIPITIEFLRACVLAFGLVKITGRTEDYGKAVATLSFDACVKLLKLPRELTPSEKLSHWQKF